MARGQQFSWTETRRAAQKMTEAVTAIANLTLPCPSLGSHLPHMRLLHPELFEASNLVGATATTASQRTLSQYPLFVGDFTALLNVLVPQLDRFGARLSSATASSIGTMEEEMFWELWCFLSASSYAFETASDQLPTQWHTCPQPFHASLSSAFHSLLTWLLSVSRSPAWLGMRAQHGMAHRNRELLCILRQPTKYLFHLTMTDFPIAVDILQGLPPSWVPQLCCIVSEQFGTGLPFTPQPLQAASTALASTYAQAPATVAETRTVGYKTTHAECVGAFLLTLVMLLKQAERAVTTAGGDGQRCCITDPAVTQLLKSLPLFPKLTLQTGPPLVDCCVTTLGKLLTLSDQAANHPNISPTGAQSSSVPRPPLGQAADRPMHQDESFMRDPLETDLKLLRALTAHMEASPSSFAACYAVQGHILGGWMAQLSCTESEQGLVPAHTVEGLAKGAVELAKQLTKHVLHFLRQPVRGGRRVGAAAACR
ncbi:MAG: hypothetical protein WDW38_008564 [Sanguina aurantia]